ncbi:MAG: hypothetical protein LBR21_04080, partial [Propionibacteriaceae bacterium]|jgi:hypothetical protein|nr:hypothetical protein [Propionibacteriaceae bacterium]
MRIGPDGNLWLSDYQSKYLHRMNFEHPTWSGWLYHYDVDGSTPGGTTPETIVYDPGSGAAQNTTTEPVKVADLAIPAKSSYMQTFKTSKETKAVAAGKLTTKAVSIKGTAKVGKKLKISFKAWKPSGVKYSYQWYRAGKKIQGATSKTYKVTTADKGKKLTAKVTGIKAGYKTAASTSKAKKVS